MDLKNLPANTCPLCRQAALDQNIDVWTCDFCGARLDFDPASRRTRITYWPAQYAALKAGVGTDWMSRRELFERVDAAGAAAPAERAPKMIGPLLIIASALLLLCVMLGAVASAIVISPSISRTRRVISQAYLPTTTATTTATSTATASAAQETAPAGQPMEQPAVTSPLSITPSPLPEGQVAAPDMLSTPTPLPTPELPTPAPQNVTQPQPVQPTQAPVLPPTFTPVPPTLPAAPTQPPALPGAQTSPLPPPDGTPPTAAPPGQPPPPTTMATATPTPAPTPTLTPTVVNAGPLQPGSQVLAGTVRIVTVFANGNTALNEADEYVELRNEGTTPAYLDGWRLKAIRNADNAQLDEYIFPGGSVIAANQTCRIYTNLPFGAENCGFAGGFANDQPIWPPNGARAVLVNPQGQEMARYVY